MNQNIIRSEKKFFSLLKAFFSNTFVQLLAAILLCSFFHKSLSHDAVRFFLTISTLLRELLIFILPFLLFSFVAVALSAIPKDGFLFVLELMLIVAVSNFCNILVSGCIGFALLKHSCSHQILEKTIQISPLFEMNLPHLIPTTYALLAGVVTGLVNSLKPMSSIQYIITTIHRLIMLFMKKFFIPLLPVFVAGFLLKLLTEGAITNFVSNNFCTCLLMFGFLIIYLMIWLICAAGFKPYKAYEIFQNSFPAICTAFSTMSSAAALPFSLDAARANTKDKVLADAVMPLTLNFHMLGDTVIVPIMAMIVMRAFDHPLPSVSNFIMFGLFFVLNKFAGGGVPSGTIMVTIPVLKEYFGFDDSMIAFIIAFYGMVDPIATSGNVAANNFFVVLFQRIHNFMHRTKRLGGKSRLGA